MSVLPTPDRRPTTDNREAETHVYIRGGSQQPLLRSLPRQEKPDARPDTWRVRSRAHGPEIKVRNSRNEASPRREPVQARPPWTWSHCSPPLPSLFFRDFQRPRDINIRPSYGQALFWGRELAPYIFRALDYRFPSIRSRIFQSGVYKVVYCDFYKFILVPGWWKNCGRKKCIHLYARELISLQDLFR